VIGGCKLRTRVRGCKLRTIYALATPEPSANGNPVPLTTCTLRCAMEPMQPHTRYRCARMEPAPALAAAAEPAAPRTVLGAPPQPAPAVEAWAGSVEAAQGRPGASSSALRGRGSAGHRRRSARSYGPRGPRTGRPRLARQQLSGASWRRELSCAWSWGTRARRWLSALVQLTGCAAAARAGSRDARVMTLGGAPRRRSRICRK